MRAAAAKAEVESSTQGRGRVVLLGVPAIRCDDQQWTLPAKAFAIIALLAAEADHALARSRIRVILWAEFDQEKANANLRQTLARVRRLEQRIGRKILNDDGQLIALNDAEFDVDLAQALSADVQNSRQREGLAGA